MSDLRLKKHVIRNLAFAWLLLSLLIGSVVYYLELARVDDFVLDRVLQDSKSFHPSLIDNIGSPDPNSSEMLQRIVDKLLTRHYVFIDVYDLNQLHVTMPELEFENKISFFFEKRHHIFPLDKKLHFEKIFIEGIQFFQVLVPLKNSQNSPAGYMEAVYKVEGDLLDSTNSRIYQNLSVVVFTTLICLLILYPIIIKTKRQQQ